MLHVPVAPLSVFPPVKTAFSAIVPGLGGGGSSLRKAPGDSWVQLNCIHFMHSVNDSSVYYYMVKMWFGEVLLT